MSIGNTPRRSVAEIMADPLASEQELSALVAETVPLDTVTRKAVLTHPNCPPSIWYHLAIQFPLVAVTSPSFALHTLEAPGAWQSLEEHYGRTWVRECLLELTLPQTQSLAIDCAERNINQREASAKRTFDQARHAVDTARLWLAGQVSRDQLTAAKLAAFPIYDAYRSRSYMDEYQTAANAMAAATPTDLPWAIQDWATAIMESLQQNDFVWVWHRLLSYYLGDPS